MLKYIWLVGTSKGKKVYTDLRKREAHWNGKGFYAKFISTGDVCRIEANNKKEALAYCKTKCFDLDSLEYYFSIYELEERYGHTHSIQGHSKQTVT